MTIRSVTNIRYAQIRSMDISNGEGIGVSLFVQGCHFHCKNCFNSEAWDFCGGKEWTNETLHKFIKLSNRPFIGRISILGGEPLAQENVKEVLNIIEEIKNSLSDKKIWLYTGYTWEEIFSNDTINQLHQEVLNNIDVLVDGRYIDELKDFALKFRGSANQRLIDVQKSLKTGTVMPLIIE